MNKFNYHTHSNFCSHSNITLEEQIIKAIKNNYKLIGFSEHIPYPLNGKMIRMSKRELNRYIDDIKKLKIKYKNKIKILCGFEAEFYLGKEDICIDWPKKLLSKKDVDFLILGRHGYTLDQEFANKKNLSNNELDIYVETMIDAIKTGIFSLIAHPDLFMANEDNGWREKHTEISRKIIDASLKYDVPIGFNVNGIYKGLKIYKNGEKRWRYPHYNFWREVEKTNAKVSIELDVHDKDFWNSNAINDANKFLSSFKLNIIDEINILK